MSKQTGLVIFACVHNAGRSQMAAAFFNQLVDSHKARAISAGTEPAAQVHDVVRAAMLEENIDLSQAKPQLLTQELAEGARLLVTMGCGENCPFVPGLERQDWPLPDPKGQSIAEVRITREKIKTKVMALLSALDALANQTLVT